MNTYIFIDDVKKDIIDSVWADSSNEAWGYVYFEMPEYSFTEKTIYGKALSRETVNQMYTRGEL